MKGIAIYLRKSRADEDADLLLGENETLTKHRTALLRLSKERKLNIIKVYEEIVSGDKLALRPQMLQLLEDVENGLYDAVLVMDMQRLGRGDMEDQGRILKAFKTSKTKIITPAKTYDLNNDLDEGYSEFEAFMGRQEYKMITRRMQSGRVRSVQEGNYIATRPPYGYKIYEEKNTRTLRPHPEQADVLKNIFDMYVNRSMGCAKIAAELNQMGIKSYTGKNWERTAVTLIIKNQIYVGKVVWKKKCIRKCLEPGKSKDAYTRPKEEWIVGNGKHPALIDQETFDKAQEIINSKYHPPYQIINGLQNPLAGLIICAKCGTKMKKRPYQHGGDHLICEICDNKSSRLYLVEDRVLNFLNDWLRNYEQSAEGEKEKDESPMMQLYTRSVKALEKGLEDLEGQKANIYDLFERKLYDENTFITRLKNVNDRMSTAKENMGEIRAKIEKEIKRNRVKDILIPKLRYVLEQYNIVDDIQQKNNLLKSVLEKVVYMKEKNQKGDEFTITIHPKSVDG